VSTHLDTSWRRVWRRVASLALSPWNLSRGRSGTNAPSNLPGQIAEDAGASTFSLEDMHSDDPTAEPPLIDSAPRHELQGEVSLTASPWRDWGVRQLRLAMQAQHELQGQVEELRIALSGARFDLLQAAEVRKQHEAIRKEIACLRAEAQELRAAAIPRGPTALLAEQAAQETITKELHELRATIVGDGNGSAGESASPGSEVGQFAEALQEVRQIASSVANRTGQIAAELATFRLDQKTLAGWIDEQTAAATQINARGTLFEEERKRADIVAKEIQIALNQLWEKVRGLSDQGQTLAEKIDKLQAQVASDHSDRVHNPECAELMQSHAEELRSRVTALEGSQIHVARHNEELLALRATLDQLAIALNDARMEAAVRGVPSRPRVEDARSVSVLQVRAIFP
jgi:chromosome segregation ATPase